MIINEYRLKYVKLKKLRLSHSHPKVIDVPRIRISGSILTVIRALFNMSDTGRQELIVLSLEPF